MNSLLFLVTYNTDFINVNLTYIDQNGRPLGIEGKANLTLLSYI